MTDSVGIYFKESLESRESDRKRNKPMIRSIQRKSISSWNNIECAFIFDVHLIVSICVIDIAIWCIGNLLIAPGTQVNFWSSPIHWRSWNWLSAIVTEALISCWILPKVNRIKNLSANKILNIHDCGRGHDIYDTWIYAAPAKRSANLFIKKWNKFYSHLSSSVLAINLW